MDRDRQDEYRRFDVPLYRSVCSDERLDIVTREFENRDDEDEASMFGKTDTPLSMCSICSGNRQYRPEELEREGCSKKPVSRDRITAEESEIDDNGVVVISKNR
jgi:hypothetical protein